MFWGMIHFYLDGNTPNQVPGAIQHFTGLALSASYVKVHNASSYDYAVKSHPDGEQQIFQVFLAALM